MFHRHQSLWDKTTVRGRAFLRVPARHYNLRMTTKTPGQPSADDDRLRAAASLVRISRAVNQLSSLAMELARVQVKVPVHSLLVGVWDMGGAIAPLSPHLQILDTVVMAQGHSSSRRTNREFKYDCYRRRELGEPVHTFVRGDPTLADGGWDASMTERSSPVIAILERLGGVYEYNSANSTASSVAIGIGLSGWIPALLERSVPDEVWSRTGEEWRPIIPRVNAPLPYWCRYDDVCSASLLTIQALEKEADQTRKEIVAKTESAVPDVRRVPRENTKIWKVMIEVARRVCVDAKALALVTTVKLDSVYQFADRLARDIPDHFEKDLDEANRRVYGWKCPKGKFSCPLCVRLSAGRDASRRRKTSN